MDTELLRSLVIVAEEGHVGRAARRLHISQPGLSKRLRRLEDIVGVKLVEPSGRGIELTASGRLLARHLSEALGVLDAAIADVRAESGSTDVVTVGFVAPLPVELTPGVLGTVGDGPAIVLSEVDWGEQIDAVTSRSVDLVLARGPVDVPNADLCAETVFVEPRLAAVSSRHRLSGSESTVLADFASDPVVVTEPNSDFWIVDPRPDGTRAVRGPVVSSVAELLEAVASGRGMAFPARSTCDAYSRTDISYIPVLDIEPASVVAVWIPSRQRGPVDSVIARLRSAGSIGDR